MASILDNPDVRQHILPISVAQYHQLGKTGIITEDTELLRGIIVTKMIKSPQHSWCVQRLANWVRTYCPASCHVRQEQPLTLLDSEPEPDVALVVGSVDDYRSAHPATAKLVIEVAISSVDLDREKASVYASVGVEEFLLVCVDARKIEVYSQPSETRYARCEVLSPDSILRVSCLPGSELKLAKFF